MGNRKKSAKYHFIAWKALAEELGFEFTPEDNERLKGVSRMQSLEILLEIGGLQFSESEKMAMAEKKNTEKKNVLKENQKYFKITFTYS